jgi:hypothetical protein
MEVQHGNSKQVLGYELLLFISINRRLGCGGLENPTFGSESRNDIKFNNRYSDYSC